MNYPEEIITRLYICYGKTCVSVWMTLLSVTQMQLNLIIVCLKLYMNNPYFYSMHLYHSVGIAASMLSGLESARHCFVTGFNQVIC